MNQVKTITEAARQIGMARSQLSRILAKPDAQKKGKKGYDVEAIAKYIEANITPRPTRRKKPEPEISEPKPEPEAIDWESMAAKKAEKLNEEVEKLRLHNERTRGELIDRRTVLQSFERIGEFIRKQIINSGLDKIQQDKIFEALDRESDRLLSGIIEDLESQLPEADEA